MHGACAPASCTDIFENADELDIDCGGHAIVRTERGAEPPASTDDDYNEGTPTAVWSGSAANGGSIPSNASQRCQDWTSTVGNGYMGYMARFDAPDWSTTCASV